MKRFILAICLLASSALSATGDYTYAEPLSHPDFDSATWHVDILNGATLAYEAYDSGSIASLGGNISVTLNVDSTYKLRRYWFTGGDTLVGGAEIISRLPATDAELGAAHGASAWTALGGGPDSWTIFVRDTTDFTPVSMLDDALLSVKSLGGTELAYVRTLSGGYYSVNITAPDSFTVQASKGGTHFLQIPAAGVGHTKDTFYVSADGQIDTVWGYMNVTIPSPPALDNVCTVYGYISDFLQGQRQYATITFALAVPAVNICDSTTIVMDEYQKTSDDSGYFSVDVVWSSCLEDAEGNAVEYKVSVEYRGAATRVETFTIPDSTTYRIWMD